MKNLNDTLNFVRVLEKRGAPILGLTYTDEFGKVTNRDVQIGITRITSRVPRGLLVTKNVAQTRNGNLHLIGVDRNTFNAMRAKGIDADRAESASVRLFRLDRISEMRYRLSISF